MALFGTTPVQNYDHVLHIVSGSSPMHDLQFNAAPAGWRHDDTPVTIQRGSLVTLNASGKFIPGFPVGNESAMACWAINSNADFDVIGDTGNFSGGTIGTFPATGGFELMTTEFVVSDLSAYTPNALLTHADGSDAGKVKPAEAAYSNAAVVGVVSSGPEIGVYDQQILRFWPVYCPAVNTTGASS